MTMLHGIAICLAAVWAIGSLAVAWKAKHADIASAAVVTGIAALVLLVFLLRSVAW